MNTKVYIRRKSRTLPSGKRVEFVSLYWHGTTGKEQSESLGRADQISRRDIETKRREKEQAINGGAVSRDNPRMMTLGDFATLYLERRRQTETGRGFRKGSPRLDDRTIDQHEVSLRYLRHHFTDDRQLSRIDADDAEAFLDALATGKLAEASKRKARSAGGLANMRKHVRFLKGIFSWARKAGYVAVNPFADFDGSQLESEANEYIPEATIEKVISACPDAHWKAVFALARFAGLRIGEALALPWSGQQADKGGTVRRVGVDIDKARLHIVAEKTGKYRVVPITPRLASILNEAREGVTDDAAMVCGGLRNGNHHGAVKIIEAAGIKPWADLFRSLRSSRENDLKVAGFAEATYTAWMGHGANVSRKSYATPQESEFDAVSKPTLRLAS